MWPSISECINNSSPMYSGVLYKSSLGKPVTCRSFCANISFGSMQHVRLLHTEYANGGTYYLIGIHSLHSVLGNKLFALCQVLCKLVSGFLTPFHGSNWPLIFRLRVFHYNRGGVNMLPVYIMPFSMDSVNAPGFHRAKSFQTRVEYSMAYVPFTVSFFYSSFYVTGGIHFPSISQSGTQDSTRLKHRVAL